MRSMLTAGSFDEASMSPASAAYFFGGFVALPSSRSNALRLGTGISMGFAGLPDSSLPLGWVGWLFRGSASEATEQYYAA